MDESTLESLVPRPTKVNYLAPSSIGPVNVLTRKQRLFVERFLRHGNATKAAREAGYSESVSQVASILILRHPRVAQEINRREKEFFDNEEVDTNWVLRRAVELAGSNILDYIDIDEKGHAKVDLSKVTKAQGAAIQELSYDLEGRPKIRLADKKASVELLARCLKLFDTKDASSSGSDGLTIQMLDRFVQNVENQNVQVNIIQSPARQELPEAP